jgi:hypothetical protein
VGIENTVRISRDYTQTVFHRRDPGAQKEIGGQDPSEMNHIGEVNKMIPGDEPGFFLTKI